MKDYSKLLEQHQEIKKVTDNFGGSMYLIPAKIRGRNKTRVFNYFISKGWAICENKDYITDGTFYGRNNKIVGVIFE